MGFGGMVPPNGPGPAAFPPSGPGQASGYGPPQGPSGAPAPDASGGGGDQTAQRGFLLVIKGTSPNANASNLLETQLCAALRKIGPTTQNPKMDYAVVKAVTVSANLIREDQTRVQQLKTDYDAAQNAKAHGSAVGMGGAPGGFNPQGIGGLRPPTGPMGQFGGPPQGGGANVPDDSAAYQDQMLGEDVRNDWEFTVLVAVVLDPKPPTPPAQAAAQ
jgi:hypothetical protein